MCVIHIVYSYKKNLNYYARAHTTHTYLYIYLLIYLLIYLKRNFEYVIYIYK